jgi:hypothetical protein
MLLRRPSSPLRRSQTLPRCRPAPLRRVPPLPQAPGACSSAASVTLGEGGEGFHLSGEACPQSLSFSSSSPDDEFS